LAAKLSVIEQSFGETDHAKAPRALRQSQGQPESCWSWRT